MNFIKLNSKIFRNTQCYLDRVLKKYELSSGSFRYLFILEHHEGISQNKLSKEVGHDKAMSARTITKLSELGYVLIKEDDRDHRAYNLYLTETAKEFLPKLHAEIQIVENIITEDLSEEEKTITRSSLEKIYYNTQRINNQEEI